MAEKRWRANFVVNTVDEIDIVHETDQFVDVQNPARGGWAATIRREAKVTSYSKLCKSRKDALEAIVAYAKDRISDAEREVERWTARKASAEQDLEKQGA